jgi:hypothetical protein
MAMLPIVIDVVSPLIRVTDWLGLLAPTVVPGNVRLVGLAATPPVPQPVSATVCGLPPSESLKLNVAVREPGAVGPKSRFTVQLADAARLAPQVLLYMEKSPGFAPENVRLLMVIGLAFPFVRVTTFWPPFLPMATAAQLTLVGEAVVFPAAEAPVPASGTVWGLLVAVSVKVSTALRAPDAFGVKTTVAEQLAEAGSPEPQLVPETAKSEEFAPLMAMLLMVIDEPAPLVRVTVWGALLDATAVLANERLAGDTEAALELAAPVPESNSDCGLLLAESVKLRMALRVPAAVGLNTTLAEQLPPAARLAPHELVEIAKSDAFAPVIATLFTSMDEPSPFFSVAERDALVDPTAVLAKVRVLGLAETPLVPSPESATVCGLLLSESLKLSVVVRVPVAVGPKRILAVQLAPAASAEPHVLLYTEKSPGLAPENVRPLMVIGLAFPFVRVTTFCPPLLPMATPAQLTLVGDTVTAARLIWEEMKSRNPQRNAHARMRLASRKTVLN